MAVLNEQTRDPLGSSSSHPFCPQIKRLFGERDSKKSEHFDVDVGDGLLPNRTDNVLPPANATEDTIFVTRQTLAAVVGVENLTVCMTDKNES